jgi:hypothetical protein
MGSLDKIQSITGSLKINHLVSINKYLCVYLVSQYILMKHCIYCDNLEQWS